MYIYLEVAVVVTGDGGGTGGVFGVFGVVPGEGPSSQSSHVRLHFDAIDGS